MDNRIVSLSYQNCIAVSILKFNNIKVLSNIDCVSYFKLCKFLIICKQLLKHPTKAAFAIQAMLPGAFVSQLKCTLYCLWIWDFIISTFHILAINLEMEDIITYFKQNIYVYLWAKSWIHQPHTSMCGRKIGCLLKTTRCHLVLQRFIINTYNIQRNRFNQHSI